MASGETILSFEARCGVPSTSAYATHDERNGHPVLDFDASTAESVDFLAVLPQHYSGGSLSAILHWMASSATSGNVRWLVSIERCDPTLDLDGDNFASAVPGTAATSATSGAPVLTTIAITGGSLDGAVAGDLIRFRVTRSADDGGDTMSGDAELLSVELREA